MDTATEILLEAARLAIKAGIGWLPVIAMVLLLAVVRVLGPRINLPPYREPPPPPPAEWGDNVTPNDGPPGGGMEGG